MSLQDLHNFDPSLFGCRCRNCRLLHLFDLGMALRADPLIESAIEIALEVVQMDVAMATSSRHELSTKVRQLGHFMRLGGFRYISEIDANVAESWIHQPTYRGGSVKSPKPSTMRNRRAAVRALFRALRMVGFEVGDPTLDTTALLDRTSRTHICTNSQMAALREAADPGLFHSTMASLLALAEAGATNSEIAQARGSHVNGLKVHLLGNARVSERRNLLTEWGAAAIARRLGELSGLADLLVATEPVRTLSNGAVSNQLRAICQFANLGRSGITINSIRAWRARQIHVETGSLEQVACFLGSRSLDAAASLIGYDWESRP
jgi:hypothetical protein